MKRFLHGHATHPDVHMALALAAAQVEAQRAEPGHVHAPTLGWVYLTDEAAAHADALLLEMQQRWPGVEWVGATGVGIAATGVEYFGEVGGHRLSTVLGEEAGCALIDLLEAAGDEPFVVNFFRQGIDIAVFVEGVTTG